MTEPLSPQDPPPPNPYQSSPPPPPYQGYEPGVAPDNVVPMGGNVPSQPAPSGQAMGPTAAPFSALVGRNLTSDETTWSMLSHIGGIILGFLAPLLVMLTKGNESPYTKYHSVEALNFQITLAIGWVAAGVLSLIGIGLLFYPVLAILNIVFCILAGLAANKGETYKYPFALRLVK
jgi:uncharacterized Tic20 family protein